MKERRFDESLRPCVSSSKYFSFIAIADQTYSLKDEPPDYLNGSGIAREESPKVIEGGVGRLQKVAACCGDRGQSRGDIVQGSWGRLRVIENVKKLTGELEVFRFGDVELLRQADIEVVNAVCGQRVAAGGGARAELGFDVAG